MSGLRLDPLSRAHVCAVRVYFVSEALSMRMIQPASLAMAPYHDVTPTGALPREASVGGQQRQSAKEKLAWGYGCWARRMAS
jgi:hypothetical protein